MSYETIPPYGPEPPEPYGGSYYLIVLMVLRTMSWTGFGNGA